MPAICMPDMLHSIAHAPLIVIMAQRSPVSVEGLPVICAPPTSLSTCILPGSLALIASCVCTSHLSALLQDCKAVRQAGLQP